MPRECEVPEISHQRADDTCETEVELQYDRDEKTCLSLMVTIRYDIDSLINLDYMVLN